MIIDFPLEKISGKPRDSKGAVIDAVAKIEYLNKLRENSKMAKKLEGIVISDEIALERYDDSKDTWVRFQRPRRWEQERIDAMQSQAELIYDTETQGQVRQRDRTPWSVIESEMVAMCLIESNLPDEEGNLVFMPGKSCRNQRSKLTDKVRDSFYERWHDLPSDLAEEIVEKLRVWHPPFDWRSGRGEE